MVTPWLMVAVPVFSMVFWMVFYFECAPPRRISQRSVTTYNNDWERRLEAHRVRGVLAKENSRVVCQGGSRGQDDVALGDVALECYLPPGARALCLKVHLAVHCPVAIGAAGSKVGESNGWGVEVSRELGCFGTAVARKADTGDLGRGGSRDDSRDSRCEESKVGKETHCFGYW